ncbi:hypothetical protein BC830DRAFT_1079533 [Chytriomyces sp. MP71]|nr:hypothetical protein BC830DRAFT_1079533 [Chytriomyces sp. MP71]
MDLLTLRNSASTTESAQRLSAATSGSAVSADVNLALLDDLINSIDSEFGSSLPERTDLSAGATIEPSLLTSMEDTFSVLQAKRPLMSGVMLKLNSTTDQSWKQRHFLLSTDGKLFLFKFNPSSDSLPITYLPIESCSAMSNPVYKTYILHVVGRGVTAQGRLEKRSWTLKLSSSREMKVWEEAINSYANPHAHGGIGLARSMSDRTTRKYGTLPLNFRAQSTNATSESTPHDTTQNDDDVHAAAIFPSVHKSKSSHALLRRNWSDGGESRGRRVSEAQVQTKIKNFEMPAAATLNDGHDILLKRLLERKASEHAEVKAIAEREQQNLRAAAEAQRKKNAALEKALQMASLPPFTTRILRENDSKRKKDAKNDEDQEAHAQQAANPAPAASSSTQPLASKKAKIASPRSSSSSTTSASSSTTHVIGKLFKHMSNNKIFDDSLTTIIDPPYESWMQNVVYTEKKDLIELVHFAE